MEHDTADIQQKYFDYKNSVHKIGLEAAQTHYRALTATWSHAHPFQLLLEFSFLQSIVYKHRHQPEKVGKIAASFSYLLSNQHFLHDEASLIITTLDWFDDLEDEDTNERMGTLQHVLEGCVHLATRCELMRCIAKHDPLIFTQAIDHLLESAHCLSARYAMSLSEMIYTMVEENPKYAAIVRFKLVEMQLLPDLVTRLTVYCEDEVDFFNGLLFKMPSWFIAQSTNSRQHFTAIKRRVFEKIQRCSENVQTNQVELAMAIRVMAGLVGFFGLPLSENEVDVCFYVLRVTEIERLVKLLLSLVLISSVTLKRQRDLVAVLTQLLQSGVSEMPMLLMVYFKTDQIGSIEGMVRSILEMQVPIPKLGLFEMQKLCGHIHNTTFSSITHA